MKTAMQELWDYVKEDKENINFIVYGKLRNKIIPLIEIEKEQIKKSFIAGYNSRSMEDMIGGSGNEENEYYDYNFSDK